MSHFDRAVLDGIEDRWSGNDFAAGEDLDLKLAAGRLGHSLGHVFGATVDGVEALREAGSQTPLDRRRILGDRRHGHAAGGKACTGILQKRTSFHNLSPVGFL